MGRTDWAALGLLCVFYGAYLLKMAAQRRRGIAANVLVRGQKSRRAYWTGLALMTVNYCACAAQPGQLNHNQPNSSAADDAHCVPMTDACPVDAVDTTGQRLCQRTQTQRRPGIEAVTLFLGYRTVLCKATVLIHTNSVQIFTHLLLPDPAGAALPAVNIRVYRHMVAHLKNAGILAQLCYHASELMAQNHRVRNIYRTLAAMVNMDIRSAHAAGEDANPDFLPFQRPKRNLLYLNVLGSQKIYCFHNTFPVYPFS